jgi:phage/plasmid-associated DNA primase
MDPEPNAVRALEAPFVWRCARWWPTRGGASSTEQVSSITQRYREEQDILAAFVKEELREEEGASTTVRTLHHVLPGLI